MKDESEKAREALQRVAKHAKSFDIRSEALLHEALYLLDEARQVPLSSSVRVNREQMAALLGEALDVLPIELAEARQMVEDRAGFMAERDRDAQEILDEVRAQAERMVQRSEIVREARRAAQHIVDEARDAAKQVKCEVDDYCDKKLAAFEVSLERVLRSVKDGRERIKTPSAVTPSSDTSALGGAPERSAQARAGGHDLEVGGARAGVAVESGSDRHSGDIGGKPGGIPGGIRPASPVVFVAPGGGGTGSARGRSAADTEQKRAKEQVPAVGGPRAKHPGVQQPGSRSAVQRADAEKGDAGNVSEDKGNVASGMKLPMVTEPPLSAASSLTEDEGGGNFFDQDKE
ncbi:MAG: hypothetical protein ACYDGY_08310 [Acidimicrobiales bacterium]